MNSSETIKNLDRKEEDTDLNTTNNTGISETNYVNEPVSEETSHISAIPADYIDDLKESFNMLDQVGNGSITPAKLYRGANSLLRDNLTESEVQDLINHGDIDGDGKIQFNEFLEINKHHMSQPTTEDDLQRAFKAFDRDDNGAIDMTDLSSMMSLLGASFSRGELQDMIKAVDSEAGSKVNFQDFKKLMEDEPDQEQLKEIKHSGLHNSLNKTRHGKSESSQSHTNSL